MYTKKAPNPCYSLALLLGLCIASMQAIAADCNTNAIPDADDITNGTTSLWLTR